MRWDHWLRPIDYFVPAPIRAGGGDARTRARILSATCLLGGSANLLGGSISPLLLELPTSLAVTNAIGSLLILACGFLMRWTGSFRLATHVVLGVGTAMTVLLYVGSGGTNLPALYALPLIPLFATLLGGLRVGLGWTAFACLAGLVLAQMPTQPVMPFDLDLRVDAFPAQRSRDIVMVIVWSAMVAMLYDLVRRRAQGEAERARERAEESEARFVQAFEANPDGIVIADGSDQKVIECNDRFLEIFGLKREGVIERRAWTRIAGLGRAQEEQIEKALAETGECDELDLAHGDALGRDLSLRVRAIRIELQGRPCVLATVRDVTERVRLEEQLRQSQKMEAVGHLAGAVAHDFNNMLTVISGYAENLSSTLSGEPAEMAREIEGAAGRSAELTRQLLAFSRRQVLKPQILDLNRMIRRLETLLQRLIGENITIELELADGLGAVRADPGQIEQVIVNLAINARDAMPGGGRLLLSTENLDGSPDGAAAAGQWVYLCVRDNGNGMDDATLQRAFEPFFTTKEMGRGTGLGLSTVHGIVSQSDGEITLQSAPGQGTRVEIYLPRIVGEHAAPDPAADATAQPAERGGTVLLVEDDEMVRRLASRTLEAAGHRVIEAPDGEEALARYREHGERLDLVLTDVVMPRRGGPDLAQALAAMGSRVPVVFMSGYPNPREDPASRLPADADLIQKPFSPATLCARVAQVLGHASRDGGEEGTWRSTASPT
ncbi:MAG: response regulator [Myxococcales bacterium]|nr:response regulator [Myxococcales bacterium]